jgi:hypothetical protein
MAKTKQPTAPSPAAPARGPIRQACKAALGYFVSGIVGGVTEPALYGLGLRYRRPLIGLAVGGFVGGVWAGATHVTALPSAAGRGLRNRRAPSPAELRTVAIQLCVVLGFCRRLVRPCVIRAPRSTVPTHGESLAPMNPYEMRRRGPNGPRRRRNAHSSSAPYEKNLLTRSREYSAVSSMSPKAMTSPA